MWREMFHQIPYTVDFRVAPRPIRPLTLFRGATPEKREGISWTLSLDQARYFARYRQAPGTRDATVWVCRVPADRMLARVKEQSFEHEVVADVRGLDIREAEPLSWWHRQMVRYRRYQGIE
jgi:hypothetical protein